MGVVQPCHIRQSVSNGPGAEIERCSKIQSRCVMCAGRLGSRFFFGWGDVTMGVAMDSVLLFVAVSRAANRLALFLVTPLYSIECRYCKEKYMSCVRVCKHFVAGPFLRLARSLITDNYLSSKYQPKLLPKVERKPLPFARNRDTINTK